MDQKQSTMRVSHVLTVARGVLLAGDEGLGVEETPVGARPYFVDDIGLEIDVERTGHVLAGGCLGEESAEAVIVCRGRVLNETTVGLEGLFRYHHHKKRVATHAEAMLDGVELPYNRTTIRTFLIHICRATPEEDSSRTRRSMFFLGSAPLLRREGA